MEDKRAKTLQALSTFIDKQRALLTRTHVDISRLNELRSRAVEHPEELANNLSEELNDGAFKLSELEETADSAPEGIEWSLFSKHDPALLQALATKSQQQPSSAATPSISDFQRRIREAKSKILDPVYSSWNLSFNPVIEPDDDDEMKGQLPADPTALKKAKEREKIKELRKNRIMPSGLTFMPSGHRTRGPGGVFIRRDVADESMDVDISLDTEGSSKPAEPTPSTTLPTTAEHIPPQELPSAPLTPLSELSSIHKSTTCIKSSRSNSLSVKIGVVSTPRAPSLSTRQRRRSSRTISSCPSDMNVDDSAFPPTPDSLPLPEIEPDPEELPEKDDNSQVLGKRSRPKSETYKQAWSTSEQQLLEALLEEIPEGEKNRWKKISKAMNGRRTPRQVASRVQKYFEKLKKFGIE
ncbi:hypothetical protein GGU10DRAFT_51393 [Lentinula aff. detonsa]|uniref:ZZ-type zinc finger-containing protein 3 n=1 Tax=Lentinula aff. detonsa TaxID=2804958 RepID=A0AA38NKS3_9AGAR|nr:hypothetical protein GGU10DRAFT_51393 [Lentinula aff. detonsa]